MLTTLKKTLKTLNTTPWEVGHEKMYNLVKRLGGDRTSGEWSNLFAQTYGGSPKTASKFVSPLVRAGYLVKGTIGYKLNQKGENNEMVRD